MGEMKTHSLAILVSLIILGTSSAARAINAQDEQLHFFATCTGRLSAKIEFQWLVGGAGSDDTQKQRDALVDILDAMTPKHANRDVLAWRIDAKHAQAKLLMRSLFGTDERQAEMARRTAEKHLRTCAALILS